MNKRNKEKARKRAWTLWSKTELKKRIERPEIRGYIYHEQGKTYAIDITKLKPLIYSNLDW